MNKKALVLVGAAIALMPMHAAAEAVLVRIAAFVPPRSVSVSKFFVPWMKSVEAEAAGTLKLQGYWGGSLGRNPRKQYDLVRDGVVDIGYVVPGYTPGQFPDFSMFELPYLIRSAVEGSVAQWRMFRKGLMRGLDEPKVIGLFSTEPNILHTRKPMKSLADLKGMKIRAAGPVYGAIAKHYGAVPIGMPVTQVTESLSRGVVDGTLLGWGGALIFRIHNVTSFHFEAPLGITPLMVAMNKKKFDSLPAKAKAALDKYGGEYVARLGGKAFDDFGVRARKIITKSKRTVNGASEAEIAVQRRAIQPVYDAWIKRTKDGELKYRTLVKILADIRAGN